MTAVSAARQLLGIVHLPGFAFTSKKTKKPGEEMTQEFSSSGLDNRKSGRYVYCQIHDGGRIMSKRKLGFLVVAIMIVGAIVPALIAPGLSEAAVQKVGWMVYTPNHPNGCAPLPYDCYVIWVYPDSP